MSQGTPSILPKSEWVSNTEVERCDKGEEKSR